AKGAFAKICTDPLLRSMRFSLPFAKKPTKRPSGEKNGCVALSVEANGWANREFSGRSHNTGPPSELPTKTIFCPSGDIANEVKSEVGGVVISRRLSAGDGTERKLAVAAATIANANTPVIQARRALRGRTAGALIPSFPDSLCASSISIR